MRLRKNQLCPLHGSLYCCGREGNSVAKVSRKWTFIAPGIYRIQDLSHPRGFRERRSPAELRKLLNRKIVEQNRECYLCHEKFEHYADIVAEHLEPKGMGGARRDDHESNIFAAHSACNLKKGSQRIAAYDPLLEVER